jgi:hypothetical protein
MIKFYLKNNKWSTSLKTERPTAGSVAVIRVAKSHNTRRARKVHLLKVEEGTT